MSDFDEAARTLLLMDKVIGASLPTAVAEAAQPVREEVERRAPRGATRELLGSIGDESDERSANRAVHRVFVSKYYAYFHEYGTSKMSARPFFRPSIDARKREAADIIARHVLRVSRKVTG